MPDNRSSFGKVFMKLDGPVGLNRNQPTAFPADHRKKQKLRLCGGVLKIQKVFCGLLPVLQPKPFCRLLMTSARGNHVYFFSYAVKAGTFFSYLCGVIRFLKQERKYRVVFSKLQRNIGFYPKLNHLFFCLYEIFTC